MAASVSVRVTSLVELTSTVSLTPAVEVSDRVLAAAGLKKGADEEPAGSFAAGDGYTEADDAPIELD